MIAPIHDPTYPQMHVQAHPLFPLITPQVLAPLLSLTDGHTLEAEEEAAAASCCAQFTRVQQGGHALLVLYLAVRQWAATDGGTVMGMGGEGEDVGGRLLQQEVAQLRVKLQALAAEMAGRMPAEGLV